MVFYCFYDLIAYFCDKSSVNNNETVCTKIRGRLKG